MRKFLKDNWSKIALLLAILLLILNYSQTKKSVMVSDSRNAKDAYDCSQKAEEIDKEETAKLNRDYRTSTTNHFNHTLKKCYVYTEVYKIAHGLSRNADDFSYSKMRDGYENKGIFQCGAGSFTEIDGGCTDGGSVYDPDFKERYRVYFTE